MFNFIWRCKSFFTFFIDINHATVVGDKGIILRTNTGGFVPVELTSFSTNIIKETVQLSWTTSTEINNRGFEIQRSFGSQDYVTIGFVQGNGTTIQQQNYTLNFPNPFNPIHSSILYWSLSFLNLCLRCTREIIYAREIK